MQVSGRADGVVAVKWKKKLTVLGLLAAASTMRGPREPKAGLADGKCFTNLVAEGWGTSVMSRSPEEDMIISGVEVVPSLRSMRGIGTAGVLGGGVDSSAGGELVLEGEESCG